MEGATILVASVWDIVSSTWGEGERERREEGERGRVTGKEEERDRREG